jgi:hypothetical protein
MDFHFDNTIALLARTPHALDALLRGLPDSWTRAREGEKTWSAAEVVAHLIHCEREDWLPRARIILDSGESRPFDPFDPWGNVREGALPVDSLLDEFTRLRTANLAELEAMHLTADDLARCGAHPMFGSVTLSNLLATWAVHDLNHIHQIARVMARPYREAIGPWIQFMSMMSTSSNR